MNKDIIVEKIEYLTSLPHSVLVEHCIYLENENDNYKAQKYITDLISENGVICEKNKEITNLQQENKQLKEEIKWYEKENKHNQEIIVKDTSILTELEEWLKDYIPMLDAGDIVEESSQDTLKEVLEKIQKLKEKYK